jgi:ubiquinone/menaquinone biosynthesis C-methylase UbiE
MDLRGDSERQAVLRDRMIRSRYSFEKDIFVSRIDSVMKPGMRLCDIGCGTGHIVQGLAEQHTKSSFMCLDISRPMVEIAVRNSAVLPNVQVFEGDGFNVPFSDNSFDVVIARLAPHSPHEVHRILKQNGHFFNYGLGPDANKEVRGFFPKRIDRSSYFLPKDPASWKEEVSEYLRDAGFTIHNVEDRVEVTHQTEEDLKDLIEMVPLVKDFDREKDRKKVLKIAEKYGDGRGIQNTWHYCITTAVKP